MAENLLKMGSAGLISYPIMSYFYQGKVLSTNLLGDVGLPLALAICSSVAFTTSELLHDYVMPHVGVSERFSTPISGAVNVGLNYGATNVVLGLMNMDAVSEVGQGTLLLSSGASVMASSYLYHNFVAPFYGYHSSSYSSSY